MTNSMDKVEDIVGRLRDPNYSGHLQHFRSWSEIDGMFREAADLIQSQQALIEEMRNRITRLEAGYEKVHERAQRAESRLASINDPSRASDMYQ